MKKIQRIVAIFLVSLLMLTHVEPIMTAAAGETDVTEQITLIGWNDQAELKYTNINFGSGVLPAFAYGAIDNDSYKYIQDYITVNGKTIREINQDTNTSSYVFTIFPSSADDKYRIPIMLLQDGDNLTVKIHSTYVATLGGDITIKVLEGLNITNGSKTYQVSSDITFHLENGEWKREDAPVLPIDITSQLVLNGWNDQAELKYTNIDFGSGVLPTFEYGAIDNDAYKYIQDYIVFNGKTVREINAGTNTSGYTFTVFPSSVADAYKIPIILFQDGQNLTMKVHSTYLNELGTSQNVIKILAGLQIVNGNKTYEVTQDVIFLLDEGVWKKVDEEPAKDITDQVSITGWNVTGDASELLYTIVDFGTFTLPANIGYGVIDNATYQYLQNYITINDKTVAEINSTTDISEYVFSTFPSAADDKYKLPIIVFQNGNTLEVKIHKNYIESLGNVDVVISVKEGLEILQNGLKNKVTEDKTFTAQKATQNVDITQDVKIQEWVTAGGSSELQCTFISLGQHILPADLAYGIMDNLAYIYLQDVIAVNGKTVREINEQTDTGSYIFSTFPSNADDKYKVPVIILAENDQLTVRIHSDYVKSLKTEKIEISVLAGLVVANGEKAYITTQDVSKVFDLKANGGEVPMPEEKPNATGVTKNVTSNVTIDGWYTTGDANELTYTWFHFGSGVLPKDLNFGIMDEPDYMYLQKYITINGKTIAEINQNTDTTGYKFATFPSTVNDLYKVPVIVLSDGKDLQIKIHNNYLKALGDGDVILGIKKGFAIVGDSGVTYQVTKDVTFTNRRNVWVEGGKEIDVTDKVNVFGWTEEGSTHSAYIEIKDYNIFKNDATDGYQLGQSLLHAITINGVTAKKINETTSTKGYEWDTFPSNASDSYKVPVILFADASVGTIRVKIHDAYLETLSELSIGLNKDFYLKNKNGENVSYYYVSEAVEFAKVGDTWSNRNKEYKVTYYLNGEQYGEVETYLFNTVITLREDPEVETGYEFSGWGYTSETGILEDVEIHGFITTIEYHIEYVLNGGKNDPSNPLIYYVDSETIVLKDAAKEGAKFNGWYKDADFTEKVESIETGTYGDIKLYACFDEDAKTGFLHVISDFWIVGVAAIVVCGVAVLFIRSRRVKKEGKYEKI